MPSRVLTFQNAFNVRDLGGYRGGGGRTVRWGRLFRADDLRSAGFQHTIMVDAPNWGQDWTFTTRDNAPTVYTADTTGNTIFSIHMYGVFDTAAEVQAYLSSFLTRGLPIVVGEFGDMHSDGNPDEDAIMS